MIEDLGFGDHGREMEGVGGDLLGAMDKFILECRERVKYSTLVNGIVGLNSHPESL